MKFRKHFLSVLVAVSMLLSTAVMASAAPKTTYKPGTYTVTANLYIDGKDNVILKNTTAYMTNPSFPPTSPVEDNADLTIREDGTMELSLKNLNSIVRLQKVEEGKGAEVIRTETATANGSDYIKGMTIRLSNDSGSYSFQNVVEKPSVVNQEFHMPLQLSVDFTGIPKQTTNKQAVPALQKNSKEKVKKHLPGVKPSPKSPSRKCLSPKSPSQKRQAPATEPQDEPLPTHIATEVQAAVKDAVSAAMQTVVCYLNDCFGIEVPGLPSKTTPTQETTPTETNPPAGKAGPSKSDTTSGQANNQTAKQSTKEGTKQSHTPVAGRYTVSANIWFTKEATGLPLNPHITNSSFPPSEPVSNNATMVVDKNGRAKVTIPITISSNIMSVKSITGLPILSSVKSGGALKSITVDLGVLQNTKSDIRRSCTVDIEMGELAMNISGLSKNHTWPATMLVSFSGLPTGGSKTIPASVQAMINEAKTEETKETESTTEATANKNGKKTISGKGHKTVTTPESEVGATRNSRSHTAIWVGGAIGVLVLGAAVLLIKRKH